MSFNYKKESHYLWTTTVMIAVYASFMHYGFNTAWANSSGWAQIINVTQYAVPALRRLHDHASGVYTNFWGAFFAGFWALSPIFWLLGVMGVPFLDANRRKILMNDTSIKRIALMLALFSFCVLIAYEFPILSAMGIYCETSDLFPVLFLTWWIVAAIIYYQGQSCRVLWVRVKSKCST